MAPLSPSSTTTATGCSPTARPHWNYSACLASSLEQSASLPMWWTMDSGRFAHGTGNGAQARALASMYSASPPVGHAVVGPAASDVTTKNSTAAVDT
eukprot:scaffold9342_cov126-Isochrysis_galbana.AAC.13